MAAENYDLLDPTASELDARKRRRREVERLKERLRPVVDSLAARRGAVGFSASDVLSDAITSGIVPPGAARSRPADYSFIGPWLSALARERVIAPMTQALASGGRVHVMAPASRDDSKGRQVKLWVATEYAA